MYKCVHALTGEEILILHPRWKSRPADLRAMDRAGLLVCQGCRQEVRVKAGAVKRAHFAHKHLQACSCGSESPGILLARAALYHWLAERFGPGAVTVEKALDGLPRPVDCWVEQPGGCLAYWAADAGIKLEPRQAILAALGAGGIRATFVLAAGMLRAPANPAPLLAPRAAALLSPTERAFLRPTPYDHPPAEGAGEDPWGTLHYLDAASGRVVTLRSLAVAHRPNWFEGVRLESSLDALSPDREEGGFVHPGEDRRLAQARARAARLEEKRRRFEQAAREPPPPPADRWRAVEPRREPEALPCASCGQITTEYWSTFYLGERKVCRCRECAAG